MGQKWRTGIFFLGAGLALAACGEAGQTVDVSGGESAAASAVAPAAGGAAQQEPERAPDAIELPADDDRPGIAEAVLNEEGVLIDLDETGILACAHAQFAVDNFGFGRQAAAIDESAAAAERASASSVPEIAALGDALEASAADDGQAAVVALLLDACVEHGHQI